jgi:hypothetical protein
MNDTTIETTRRTGDERPCCAHAAAAHEHGRDIVREDRRAARDHAPPLWVEAAEVGAILVAAGGAHAVAGALGRYAYGGWLLVAVGGLLLAAALTGRRALRRMRTG